MKLLLNFLPMVVAGLTMASVDLAEATTRHRLIVTTDFPRSRATNASP